MILVSGIDTEIFFDFDNTITPFDVLDDIIRRFSINEKWVMLESSWMAGEIGSEECLRGQLSSVRVTKDALSEYLSKVEVDAHFHKLSAALKKRGLAPVILSDNFSFIIESILRNNKINGIKIYSNRLRFSKDRIIPLFPYKNKVCPDCANCKKMHLSKNGAKGKMSVYIGDGLSDICPAQNCDFVFAKGTLLENFKKSKRRYAAFENLGDVYNRLII